MKRVYIPISILKKRIKKVGYKPIMFNGNDTSFSKYKYVKRDDYSSFWIQLVTGLIAVSLIYYIIINPILSTTVTRSEINEILAQYSNEDRELLGYIKYNNKVLEEQVTGGVIYSVVLSVESEKVGKVLEDVNNLSRLKEVYVDGNKLGFSVLLSQQ